MDVRSGRLQLALASVQDRKASSILFAHIPADFGSCCQRHIFYHWPKICRLGLVAGAVALMSASRNKAIKADCQDTTTLRTFGKTDGSSESCRL